MERIPATRRGNYLFVEGRLGGRGLRLVIDSGANAHAFDRGAAERLGLLRNAVTVRGVGAGATVEAKLFSLEGLHLGKTALRASQAAAVPMPEELDADAVLGFPLFDAYAVTLDYAAASVALTKTEDFTPPAGAVALPLRLERGLSLVEVQIDGVRGWFHLDTGDGGSVTLNAPFVARNVPAGAFPGALRLPTGKGVGGVTYGRVARGRSIGLGPFAFPRPLVNLSEARSGVEGDPSVAGRLGAEILSRFTVHFHYRRKTLFLTPNADRDRPFAFNRCGLFINRDGARRTILAVLPDSPAASAGIEAGEDVLALDGKPVETWDPYALKERLRGPIGATLTLRLRRGGEPPRTVALTLKELL